MAGMDVAKRHVPRDGHIRINHPQAQVDIRVATIPTIAGETMLKFNGQDKKSDAAGKSAPGNSREKP